MASNNKKLPESFFIKINEVKKVLSIISQYDNLLFKGGTSLSLTHNVIKRFSEDIDISYIYDFSKSKKINQKLLDKLNEKIKKDLNKKYKDSWKHDGSNPKIKNNKYGVYTISIENNAPTSEFDEVIKRDRISLEVPLSPTQIEYKYSKVKPFEDAAFKMNVMDLEAIFWDKTFLIFEKFSYSSISWFIERHTNARHIYDLQMLMQIFKKSDLNKQLIINRFLNEVYSMSNKRFRGTELEKRTRKEAFFSSSQREAWEQFESEVKTNSESLLHNVNGIVYPNADKFSISEFLKNYEPIFKYLLKICKEELKGIAS